MDVKQILAEAWEAVDGAGLPEHVQVAALEQAVLLISGRGGPLAAPSPGLSSPSRHAHAEPDSAEVGSTSARNSEELPSLDEDVFFARFADESGVEEEQLRAVYYIKNGAVKIATTRRALGGSEAERNRSVAMLAVAHRWYVDGKPNIAIGEIREAIKQVGYEASRNLSAHMGDVAGTQAVGSGNDKGIRTQGGKFDAPFAELIARLVAK